MLISSYAELVRCRRKKYVERFQYEPINNRVERKTYAYTILFTPLVTAKIHLKVSVVRFDRVLVYLTLRLFIDELFHRSKVEIQFLSLRKTIFFPQPKDDDYDFITCLEFA